ncbi:hypothetical protein D8B26_002234 [Coccidioides posadasii str. Silveira]|uniref:Cell pattern formation-associated protein STUA n=2 Tax=Coccidioides posadasii TaxID=199306 RepID=E9DDF9_COCPS|nr:cell pattern formation-associated protein [Coccidioides posadasii str. Silveira]KMM65624.1 cell pattern formation-associated protein stuA [Coccidioides posadasii RMSCC 3488]QVM07535.1 hypothetical protein D8B26_002234 [Coccidioides posadasii str. Silveira]
MNQTQSYMDVHSSHLPSAQAYTSQPGAVETLSHYPYQQPPLLQPGPTAYAPTTSAYPYGYSNPVTSPQSSSQPVTNSLAPHAPAQILPLPAMTTTPNPHGYAGSNTHTPPYNVPHTFDTTGQVAPPGMKPRVTATLWEDEGTLCFQVEAKGVCVARREDNHMINGTKLLNVAGMTRGRRDGILKSEKVRHVVKIGPMHLKGVWIPFERALEFANKEKITDLLYPLFVHNIGGLLYHPSNQTRPNSIVAATERRRIEANQQQSRSVQGPQPPPLHHHHSMHNPVTSQVTQPSSQALIPAGRPSFERAHTFPTPPASASSLVGVTNQGSSYDWAGNVHNSHALSIETGLGNSRSMPTTPATTPPSSNLQSMQSYQSQQTYDSKSYYPSAPSSQPPFTSQQPTATQNMSSQGNGQVTHGTAVGEGGQEHESEYINDTNGPYSGNRGSYNYSTGHSSSNLHGEPTHLSSDITNSASSTNGTDRIGSRPSAQSQWTPGYSTPRLGPPSSLYNVVSDTRSTPANGPGGDTYSASSNSASVYPSSGLNGSGKRSRDDDDQEETSRADSQHCEVSYEHKRRKTLTENPIGGPVGGASLALQSLKNGGMPRRR